MIVGHNYGLAAHLADPQHVIAFNEERIVHGELPAGAAGQAQYPESMQQPTAHRILMRFAYKAMLKLVDIHVTDEDSRAEAVRELDSYMNMAGKAQCLPTCWRDGAHDIHRHSLCSRPVQTWELWAKNELLDAFPYGPPMF